MGAPRLVRTHHKLTLAEAVHELVRIGIVRKEQGDAILKDGAAVNGYPLDTIARAGIRDRRPPHLPLTLDKLTEWLATYAGKPYFDIDPLKIDIKAVTQVLPTAYVRRLQVIPVGVDAKRVVFATAEPFDLAWMEEVHKVVGKEIEIVVSSPIQIKRFLEEFFVVQVASRDFKRENPGASGDFGRTLELDQMLGGGSRKALGDNAAAVVRIVDWLFQFAHDERATDIHMEPKMGLGHVRFRIDGHMRVVYRFEPELMLPIVSRMKILANMQVDEKRKPQDGRIRYQVGPGKTMEMRLSTIPTHYGEKLVIRIFDPKMAGKSFEDLGFAPSDIKIWEGLINEPHGLVLVTGPTGSGKSTTLHTSLRLIAKEDVNVCTVEDPIEIVNDELNQMQVNTKLKITFGNAIRAFLRQDPDIIMVGEIRDSDAGKMAIQAALTGHLVLSTLHTNDALSSITRLIDLDIPPHLITATIRGMMAQRLVRRLCEFCKTKAPTPKEGWQDIVAEHKIAPPAQVFQPAGCRECKHSGYMGRLCIYEMIVMDRPLRDTIRRTVTLEQLMDVAKGKYIPLRVNAASKVAQGVTSIEEVMRVIF